MTKPIRNFCIIAHIDHGKSTLADRMLEITDTVRKVDRAQSLDRMDIEQERGITIKLTPTRMARKEYEFNLIDTPGHVDFQYEVSRSLAAVEGAILLVDASQGVQAQTLSTLYMALDQGLEIIPVLNKVDLPAANPERVWAELQKLLGVPYAEILQVSGKTGLNVDKVLDRIVELVEDPERFKSKNRSNFWRPGIEPQTVNVTRALVFDSVFDPYKGVVAYVKVVDGTIKPWEPLALAYSETIINPPELGYFTPDYHKDTALTAGQIGYIVTGRKSVRDIQIGDTIMSGIKGKGINDTLKSYVIPGFKKVKPFVYAWVYPIENTDYDKLKDSFEKLILNDSAVEYEHEVSTALGFGFRTGFLGMLHMDIIKERLSREYNVETIFTAPSVIYLVKSKTAKLDQLQLGTNVPELVSSGLYKYILQKNGGISEQEETRIKTLNDAELAEKFKERLGLWFLVRSGADMPVMGLIEELREPLCDVEVVGPQEYAGVIMQLCQEHRGDIKGMEYLDTERVIRKYRMPLSELIIDFYDKLKSNTKGYGTMNYDFVGYESGDLVPLDIYINGEPIEAFRMIVHKDKAFYVGRDIVSKLKDLIPKHQFVIPIQAGIGTKMIARETISAMRKDVIAKCYGGDVTRKRKLLEKQKEGKKKMKAMGNVNVPSDVFMKMIQND